MNGGNVQWLQKKLVCPNCALELKNGFTSKDKDGNYCCQDVPEDSPGMCVDTDGDPNSGCEQYRVVSGADEAALPAEMGLYKKFVVGGSKSLPKHSNLTTLTCVQFTATPTHQNWFCIGVFVLRSQFRSTYQRSYSTIKSERQI